MTPKVVDFDKIIPPQFLKQLATANENHKLNMVLVISNEALKQLNGNKTASLVGNEGSCIVLVPQALLEEYYE